VLVAIAFWTSNHIRIGGYEAYSRANDRCQNMCAMFRKRNRTLLLQESVAARQWWIEGLKN
jgi:hypothetical protein